MPDGALLVWIDQDLCTGCSLCEALVPEVFAMGDDHVAYVREGERIFDDPGGAAQKALVPTAFEAAVLDAAAENPVECIFTERR